MNEPLGTPELPGSIEELIEMVERDHDICPKCGCHKASGSSCPDYKQPCPFDDPKGYAAQQEDSAPGDHP